MQRIVVGVDGSENAVSALLWAINEGNRHGAVVIAVMAWDYLDQHHADGTDTFDPSYGRDEASKTLRAMLQAIAPSRPIEERAVLDRPAQALLDACADADLLVVGARGLGGFKGLLLGSVSERVLEDASCPVVVVRESESPHRPPGRCGRRRCRRLGDLQKRTAVGGRRSAVACCGAACGSCLAGVAPRRAEERSVPVRQQGGRAQDPRSLVAGPCSFRSPVEGHLSSSGPAAAVLELAADASMITIGSRGLGRFERAALGSTSRQLAHHAPCPIVVVPANHNR